MVINSPCKDCIDRVIGCHSSCVGYLKYKDRLREYNEEVRRFRIGESKRPYDVADRHYCWESKVRKSGN